MAAHKSPKEKREIVKEYLRLCVDMKRTEASELLAEKYGVSPSSIRGWGYKIQTPDVEMLVSEDFEVSVKPDVSPPKAVTIVPEGKRFIEIIASDIHFPYEDGPAYECFVTVAEAIKPDIVVLLGDIMDCYAVSSHDKDPDRATPQAWENEVTYTRTKLGELRSRLPDARIIYFEGNHETRLSRFIRKNAAQLSKMQCVSIPEFLKLSELNIEWIPNGGRLRIGRLWHIHGNEVAGAGQSPARLKYQRMQCSFVFGHHHTRDKYRPRAYDGSQHGAYANPCLCDLNAEYLHHAHNWSHGFTIVEHDTDMTFQVEETEVISTGPRSAKCNVRGEIYEVQV